MASVWYAPSRRLAGFTPPGVEALVDDPTLLFQPRPPTLLQTILLVVALVYSTLLYSTLLYSTRLYSTLLYL